MTTCRQDKLFKFWMMYETRNGEKNDVVFCSCLEREDLVRVHDGGVWMAPVIAALCNQAYQLEVLSTGPDLLVRLSARSPNPGQGFKATFEFESITGEDLQHLDPKQSGILRSVFSSLIIT